VLWSSFQAQTGLALRIRTRLRQTVSCTLSYGVCAGYQASGLPIYANFAVKSISLVM